MSRSNPIADRFISKLYDWLTPDLLYHCFTGEMDEQVLKHIAGLTRQPWLLEPVLEKVEREWPERLRKLAAVRRREEKISKLAVQQYVLNFNDPAK